MRVIERLAPIQFPLVNRFYKEAGHKGKARGDDIVYVVREQGKIIAAVRLCPTQPPHSEWLLLRGMWVLPSKQRQGIGSELMVALMHALSDRKIWCYPFRHLEAFYGLFGFSTLLPEMAPEFMAGPFEAYSRAGKKILIMQFSGVEK